MSRGELLALVWSMHSEAATTLQPCNQTLNVYETDDVGWTQNVTLYSIDHNVTETLPADNFSTTTAAVLNDTSFPPPLLFDQVFVEFSLKEGQTNKRKCEMAVGPGCKVDTSVTWTLDDPTRNLSAGEITSSIAPRPALNGSDLIANQSDPRHITRATTVWSANATSDAYVTVGNQTYDSSTRPTSIEDWRTPTADGNVSYSSQNSTSTKPSLNMYGNGELQLPWWFLNNSYEQLSLFADMINQHRHEMQMVPPPGDGGSLPEHVSPVSAVEESHRYHTVVGLVIWNVVVTMLLFTVIVALFLVCTNNRRTRIHLADRDSYAVTSAEERTKAAQLA